MHACDIHQYLIHQNVFCTISPNITLVNIWYTNIPKYIQPTHVTYICTYVNNTQYTNLCTYKEYYLRMLGLYI